jgi:hypothetical protein
MVATAGQSLAGVFVSLVVLVVAMLLCAWLDRPSILPVRYQRNCGFHRGHIDILHVAQPRVPP